MRIRKGNLTTARVLVYLFDGSDNEGFQAESRVLYNVKIFCASEGICYAFQPDV